LQERERTTWLSEDEDVWGTDPAVGPGVIGRDVVDQEPDPYDDFDDRGTQRPQRTPSRQNAR
jgi:hypothetical protein